MTYDVPKLRTDIFRNNVLVPGSLTWKSIPHTMHTTTDSVCKMCLLDSLTCLTLVNNQCVERTKHQVWANSTIHF